MGLGIYSICNNQTAYTFGGTLIENQCMHGMDALATLPPGANSQYFEITSGEGCEFQKIYMVEGYTPVYGSGGDGDDDDNVNLARNAGNYNFILGYANSYLTVAFDLSQDSPWVQQKIDDGSRGAAYLWTLPGGVAVKLDGFDKCGAQVCIKWSIPPGASSGGDGDDDDDAVALETVKTLAVAPSALTIAGGEE